MNDHIQDQVTAYMSEGVLLAVGERIGGGSEADTSVERAQITNKALERYFHLLDDTRRRLRHHFSEGELSLMCDACNGTWWEANSMAFLPLEIIDAVKLDRLDEKWGVDGDALIAKLNALDLLSLCTLVDGIERFWSGEYSKERADFSIVLK